MDRSRPSNRQGAPARAISTAETRQNIRCNAVAPGLVLSPLAREMMRC